MNTDNISPVDLEIRNILVKKGVDFIFIMPDLNSKKILIERYKKREIIKSLLKEQLINYKNGIKKSPILSIIQ